MTKRPRGPLPGWEPRTARQQAILADVLDRYQTHHDEGTLPRGGRGIFYDLRPHGYDRGITYEKHPAKKDPTNPKSRFLNPMAADPNAVRDVLLLARRAGKIPESWVADTRAPTPHTRSYDTSAEQVAAGVAAYVRTRADRTRLDPQRGQPVYIEVLCEAADLAPRLARVALTRGVPVYSGGGFDGLKAKRELAWRAADRDVPTVVLAVTDLDRDGLDIFHAAAEDAVAWAHHEDPTRVGAWLRFERIAVTRDQAVAHELLAADEPLGDDGLPVVGKAEADGIPVPVMDRVMLDAIDQLQDPTIREETERLQAQERERLPELIWAALDGPDGAGS